MTDETPQQAPQDQSAPTSQPAVEPVPISEAEIQQAIQSSADWSQKSEDSGRREHK